MDMLYPQGWRRRNFACLEQSRKNDEVDMDISAFETRLNELLNEISDLPAEQSKKLLSLALKSKFYDHKLKENMDNLGDSLDRLRLTIKYLLFDLEATRRENKYLRKMLESNED